MSHLFVTVSPVNLNESNFSHVLPDTVADNSLTLDGASMTSRVSLTPIGSGAFGLAVTGSQLLRTLPEPRSSLVNAASTLLSTGAQVAGAVIPGADVLGVGNLESLLQMQIQIQQVMQYFSMQSNIEKSKHETEMAPIRNMRVG